MKNALLAEKPVFVAQRKSNTLLRCRLRVQIAPETLVGSNLAEGAVIIQSSKTQSNRIWEVLEWAQGKTRFCAEDSIWICSLCKRQLPERLRVSDTPKGDHVRQHLEEIGMPKWLIKKYR